MGCDAPNHPPFRGQQVSAIEIALVDLDILDVLCATAEMAAGVLSQLQQGATETAAEFARASARRSDQSRQPRVCTGVRTMPDTPGGVQGFTVSQSLN